MKGVGKEKLTKCWGDVTCLALECMTSISSREMCYCLSHFSCHGNWTMVLCCRPLGLCVLRQSITSFLNKKEERKWQGKERMKREKGKKKERKNELLSAKYIFIDIGWQVM